MLREARLGIDRDTLVVAHGWTQQQMGDPDFLARLQATMARGDALHKIDLARELARVRVRGGTHAILASLREKLGWQIPGSERKLAKTKPDDEAAVADLERVLRRFRGPSGGAA